MTVIMKLCASISLYMMLAFVLSACGNGGSSSSSTDENQAPVVLAGPDFTVNLPNSGVLVASVTDDSLPLESSLASTWQKVSGNGTVTFSDGQSLASQVTFSQAGSYVLKLSVSDGEKSGNDTVTVLVNSVIEVGGYVVKASHSLPVNRTLPSDPQSQVQFTIPDASTGLTTLSAVANTFENSATLFVINLSTQRKYQFNAQVDGSLLASEVFAPYGSELLIRVDHPLTSDHLNGLPTELKNYIQGSSNSFSATLSNDESLRSVSGFRINILPNTIASGEFYSVGLVGADGKESVPLSVTGTLASTTGLSNASQVNMAMTMRLFAAGNVDNPQAEFSLKPTHNAQGVPLGSNSRFTGTQVDALGNLISNQVERRTTVIDSLALTLATSDSSGINFTLNNNIDFSEYENSFNSHGLFDGHYILGFNLGHNSNNLSTFSLIDEVKNTMGDITMVLEGAHNTLLLPVEVGGALLSAQEPLVFFMDTTQDGYVGLYDQATFPEFGLNLISHLPKNKTILQRFRADGGLREYDFAPFFPRLSTADRNSPSTLLMDIDAKSSSLSMTLTDPDNQETILPSVNGQYLQHIHDKDLNAFSRSAGGVHMTDVLQMTLQDTTGSYKRSFAKSGDYQLKVEGMLKTINGKEIVVDQSMNFTVVDYLVTPLYSTLPMMPLQAGESITPIVTLMPAISANVTVKMTYAIDSVSPSTTTFSGKANASGIFVADSAMLFDQAGIYSVEITVKHTDDNGYVYGGNRHFSSVVANEVEAIATHGKRGVDNFFEQSVTANRWFSRDALSNYDLFDGHVLAPYEHGDIEWVEDDAAGVVRASLAYDADLKSIAQDCENADLLAWQSSGELSLTECIPSSLARPLNTAIPNLGFSAYSYNAAERFSVRVRESIGDEDAHGYWRFDDSYGNQRGMGSSGDQSSELKIQFIGTVINDYTNLNKYYSSHASVFVLTDSDGKTENDTRVFPPFNGHDGLSGGGAILKLAGRDVDGFIWPTTLVPGSVLKQSDSIPFYGQMAPTLPMHLNLSITAPDGTKSSQQVQANKNGFVQTSNILFDQVGVYSVQPALTYKAGQETSAGELASDFVIDHALLAVDNRYYIFVTDNEKIIPMNINFDANPEIPTTLNLASNPTFRVLTDIVTKELTELKLYTSVFMDGWILERNVQAAEADLQSLGYTLNLSELAKTFNTIDVSENSNRVNNYTDLIRVSFLLEGKNSEGVKQVLTRTFTLDGENLLSNGIGVIE